MFHIDFEKLKQSYDKVDERYFSNDDSINFEFWRDLYYDVDTIATDAIDMINELSQELKDAKENVDLLTGRILTLEDENETLRTEINTTDDNLRTEENDLIEANEALTNELLESEAAYNELYDYVEELEDNLKESQEEIDLLNEEINELL